MPHDDVKHAWPTVREAAARLGCAERTVLLHIQKGKLTGARVGKEWRIAPESVEQAAPPRVVAAPAPRAVPQAGADAETAAAGSATARPSPETAGRVDPAAPRKFTFRDVTTLRALADLAATVGRSLAQIERPPEEPARAAGVAALSAVQLGAAGYHAFVAADKARLYGRSREQAAMAAAALWLVADLSEGRAEGLRALAEAYERAAGGLGGLMRRAARRHAA